jgi:bacillithiol biosynthesis deacetylase BshB1
MNTKVDILFCAAHPDDVELSASGTLITMVEQGKKVAMLDFTEGELGTRGSAEIRHQESAESAKILGVSFRENLKIRDGFFQPEDEETLLKLITKIRKFQPEILICNAVRDRHPDHGRASELTVRASFLSGLMKIQTIENGETQKPWRPKQVYHYIQNDYIEPDFLIDITSVWDKKIAAIQAYKSQFFDPKSDEPETHISSKRFIEFIEARHRELGNKIGVPFAEGFTVERTIGVKNLFDLL